MLKGPHQKPIEEAEQKNDQLEVLVRQIEYLEVDQQGLQPGDPEQINLERQIIALRKKFDGLMRKLQQTD